MLEVIARIGSLHAQLLSSAELTARARIEGLDRGAVQQALWEVRGLVKNWAIRWTLHLLLSSELTLWQTAFNTDPRLRHSKKAKRIEVRIEPFVKLPAWAPRVAQQEPAASRVSGRSARVEMEITVPAERDEGPPGGKGLPVCL